MEAAGRNLQPYFLKPASKLDGHLLQAVEREAASPSQ